MEVVIATSIKKIEFFIQIKLYYTQFVQQQETIHNLSFTWNYLNREIRLKGRKERKKEVEERREGGMERFEGKKE